MTEVNEYTFFLKCETAAYFVPGKNQREYIFIFQKAHQKDVFFSVFYIFQSGGYKDILPRINV